RTGEGAASQSSHLVSLASTAMSHEVETPAETPDRIQFIPGTLIAGRYRIRNLIGVGGMGEVYRAKDLKLGQSVALKFLATRFSNSQSALRHLRNEVRIARAISHPNVCRVHDLGVADGHHFLSMEYIDGEDLR